MVARKPPDSIRHGNDLKFQVRSLEAYMREFPVMLSVPAAHLVYSGRGPFTPRRQRRVTMRASSPVRRPGGMMGSMNESRLDENQRRALATARLQLRIDAGLCTAITPAERRAAVVEARMDARRGKLDG